MTTAYDLICVADTETTGTNPAEGAALLELAVVPLWRQGTEWTYGESLSSLVEHVGEIPPEARAVHHIGPSMVSPGAPGVDTRESLLSCMLAAETDETLYSAHNAKFDRAFLPELGGGELSRWIDTYQCARHIWPDAPRHSNQVLRYWLGVEPRAELIAGLEAHRALYDAAVTAEILRVMLRDHSPEDLIRLSGTPVLLKICQFNKHRGTPWAEVPRDYLRWMVREGVGRDDEDLQHTIRHYLHG